VRMRKKRRKKRMMNGERLYSAALEHSSGILESTTAMVILFSAIMVIGTLLCVGIALYASHRQLKKLREEQEERKDDKDDGQA